MMAARRGRAHRDDPAVLPDGIEQVIAATWALDDTVRLHGHHRDCPLAGAGGAPAGMVGRYLSYPPGCWAPSQAAARRDDVWQSHAS